jgi:hypothetical protein
MASINIVCMVLRVCSIVPKRKSAVQHSPTSLEVKFLEWLRIYILGTSGRYIYILYILGTSGIYILGTVYRFVGRDVGFPSGRSEM